MLPNRLATVVLERVSEWQTPYYCHIVSNNKNHYVMTKIGTYFKIYRPIVNGQDDFERFYSDFSFHFTRNKFKFIKWIT